MIPVILDTKNCRAWIIYQSVFLEVLTIAAEVILTMRRKYRIHNQGIHTSLIHCIPVYFLYNRNNLALWTILLLFAAEVVLMMASLGISVVHEQFDALDCSVVRSPNTVMIWWYVSPAEVGT